MAGPNGQTVVDNVANIDQVTGPPIVSYDWLPGDTDNSGEHKAEFKVTYADGRIETFPNNGFIHIPIIRDISDLP
jgi:hypothetical protein